MVSSATICPLSSIGGVQLPAIGPPYRAVSGSPRSSVPRPARARRIAVSAMYTTATAMKISSPILTTAIAITPGAESRTARILDTVIVAFSISPMNGDESGGVGDAVAEAVRVVRESGLPNETNAMFTNIEGEWDDVMAVVKRAVAAVAAVSSRVSLVLKADIRPGYTDQLTAKVEHIERVLGG